MAKPRKSYFWWIFGKALYGLLGLGILVMVIFLLWRVYFSGALPEEMERISPNGAIAAAYKEKGDALLLQTQEQSTHTRGENNYGYFAVPRFVFIPEANQVQVVFRYNNSTLEATQRDFSLGALPPRGEEIFDVSLLQITDLTPEDQADNVDGSAGLGEARIAPTSVTVTTTSLYTYFLYTFDNVTVTDDTFVIYFDIYYKDALDYTAAPYGSLRLYHKDAEWRTVRLTGKDKKALEGFTP